MPKDKDPPAEMPSASAQKSEPRSKKLDKSIQNAIGARLRAYYDEVAREEVPDRFVQLLRKLDEKESTDGEGG